MERKTEKQYRFKVLKIICSIFLFVAAILTIIKVLPYFRLILTEEGRQIFKQDIQTLGKCGYWVIIALLVVKALFIFLPR